MTEESARRPAEVAAELGISAATLRRWTRQFARFLSSPQPDPSASDDGQSAQRRYTNDDLESLLNIKGLLAEGFNYQQVEKRLEALRVGPKPEGDVYPAARDFALVTTGDDRPALSPAVAVLADTLHTVAQSQQAVLNSQQTNRDLMGVVIQDNFNLKSENAKLRDRMLELERELSEVKRHSEADRETFEARLQTLEAVLATPASPEVEPPAEAAAVPPSQNPKKKGFWARLWGEAE
ncbi:MAG: MerR family transcriptional regulator [Anaerolineae bacterium]|nr:MerR family transcriptional regulator [Anaerolineae bacterium]